MNPFSHVIQQLGLTADNGRFSMIYVAFKFGEAVWAAEESPPAFTSPVTEVLRRIAMFGDHLPALNEVARLLNGLREKESRA